MLFSSKYPSRRRVRARVLPREGNELERRWKRRRGPPKKRHAREDEEEINGSFVGKENIYRLRKRYIYRFVVKSLRTRTKDATGRFDANGEGRAVERSSGSVARGIKGRVAESTTSVSTRALCSGDDGSKTSEILRVS